MWWKRVCTVCLLNGHGASATAIIEPEKAEVFRCHSDSGWQTVTQVSVLNAVFPSRDLLLSLPVSLT